MASHCSEQCITGWIHAGQPHGTIETLHGLDTYIIGNRTNPRGIIVIYSDVFGLALPNNKLIADAYAKSGEWLVYLPDFFKGDPLPLKVADLLIPVDPSKVSTLCKYGGLLASAPGFVMWMTRHKDGPTDRSCMDWLEGLRKETPKERKIGMVGFCWGGRYAIRAARESNMINVDGQKVSLIDAAVALHPSNLTFPADAENLVVPVSCGWGRHDSEVKFEQKAKFEAVVAQAKKVGRVVPETEHKIYEPGRHGFAVRGNLDDPKEKACLEGSVAQALDWMGRWL